MTEQDQAWIEQTKRYDPQWTAVRFVFAPNYDKSMVNQLWSMWRPKIAGVLRDRSRNTIKEFFKKVGGAK